jgi:protein-disulfide isomerase
MTETLLSTAAKNLKLKSEEVIALTTLAILIIQVVLLVTLTRRVISLERVFTSAFNVQPPAPIVLDRIPDERGYALGYPDAPVTIVEFADYECPSCATAAQSIRDIIKRYPGKIRFVLRHFPLTSIHSNAFLAALAVECAGEQGKFWDMHNSVFENQSALSPETIMGISQKIGLDGDQFSECLNSRKYETDVNQDVEDGERYGVEGTPTFFVNKQLAPSVGDIERLVQEAIK